MGVQCYLLELMHDFQHMLPLGQLCMHLLAASRYTGLIDTVTSKQSHGLFSKLPENFKLLLNCILSCDIASNTCTKRLAYLLAVVSESQSIASRWPPKSLPAQHDSMTGLNVKQTTAFTRLDQNGGLHILFYIFP